VRSDPIIFKIWFRNGDLSTANKYEVNGWMFDPTGLRILKERTYGIIGLCIYN